MTARSALDDSITRLQLALGKTPKEKATQGQVSSIVDVSARTLLERLIGELESSLNLRQDEEVASPHAIDAGASASSAAREADGNGDRPATGSRATNALEAENACDQWQRDADTASRDEQPEATKLDLRVGLITKVWVHEGADKLYCEEIDVGEGAPRQIASGLVAHYGLEDMKGRQVVVVCNLKARNLKGFKSHGMVLCAVGTDACNSKEQIKLVEPPKGADAGEKLVFDGVHGGPFQPASAAQMEKKKILEKVLPEMSTDRNGAVIWRRHVLLSSQGACAAPDVRHGAVR